MHDLVIAYPAERGTWITSLPDDATVTVVAKAVSPRSLHFAAEMRERTLSIAADELLARTSSIGREAPDPGVNR